MDVDTRIPKGQTAVAIGGAAGAKGLEYFNHLTLADMASAAVLIFTVYQFHAMFYDRNIKPRGGWLAVLGLRKK